MVTYVCVFAKFICYMLYIFMVYERVFKTQILIFYNPEASSRKSHRLRVTAVKAAAASPTAWPTQSGTDDWYPTESPTTVL